MSFFFVSTVWTFKHGKISHLFSSCSAAEVVAASQENRKFYIRADGTTMVDGQPFFPFGLYQASWESPNDNPIEHIRQIAAGGFNIVHASAITLDKYEKFLDEAHRLGIYVISRPDFNILTLVNAFKRKPAVIGWNLADDVDNGKRTPEQVLKSHAQVKAADPNHVTYVTGYTNQIGRFANCSDILAIQTYPVREGKPDLGSTYSLVSLAHNAAVKYNKAVYVNVQAFDWATAKLDKYKNARPPTADEVRNMTYQAILAGAKGIIYYSYHYRGYGGWHLPDNLELWEGMKSLVPEIKQLSPMFLDGSLTKINTRTRDLFAGIWELKGQVVAAAINTSYDRPQEVAIALPTGAKSARPIFPNRASGMFVKDGKLFGSIKPLEVHIYQIEK
ncbi:MAG: hypothetical protein ACRC62_17625 [Microcoleus sp.]